MAADEGESAQQYCVRWNSHLCSLSSAFPQLLDQQRYVDVSLACEGQQIHCHKVVLAACSKFFDSLLSENPCKHPIIILPTDIKLWTVQALVEFMYKGQVNVSQAGLPDLVRSGDILQIRGLCNTDIAAGLTLKDRTNAGSSSGGGGGGLVKPKQSSISSSATPKTAAASKAKTRLVVAAVEEGGSDSKKDEMETQEDDEQDEENKNPEPEENFDQPKSPTTTAASSSSPTPTAAEASSAQVPPPLPTQSSSAGQIRVKSLENLFENYKSADAAAAVATNGKPASTVISLDDDEDAASEQSEEVEIMPWSIEPRRITKISHTQLPPALKFDRNSMDIYVTTTPARRGGAGGQQRQETNNGGGGFVYGPTSSNASSIFDDSFSRDGVSEIICAPTLAEFSALHDDEEGNASASNYQDTDDDIVVCNELIPDEDDQMDYAEPTPPPLLQYSARNQFRETKQHYLVKPKREEEVSERAIDQMVQNGVSLENAFILRTPRGNQPRSYTEGELYCALKEVKEGLSIYRASQKYRVPRKTLRNWMKRWKIKSAFPMPKQLQRAAEKKKAIRDQAMQGFSFDTFDSSSERPLMQDQRTFLSQNFALNSSYDNYTTHEILESP